MLYDTKTHKIGSILFYCVSCRMTSQVVRQNFHLHITDCVNATLGLDNFKSDVHKMLGHTPNIYWRICWKVISPAFLAVRTVLGQQLSVLFSYFPIYINHTNNAYWVNIHNSIAMFSLKNLTPRRDPNPYLQSFRQLRWPLRHADYSSFSEEITFPSSLNSRGNVSAVLQSEIMKYQSSVHTYVCTWNHLKNKQVGIHWTQEKM
jgi:hypothetical protein